MYCPRCATHLPQTALRCDECGLDVRSIAAMLQNPDRNKAAHAANRVVARLDRFKRQRNSWGTLLIMSSLLVGCLIPISMALALFGGFTNLGPIILGLAGFAGVLLFTGSMLLMASENTIFVGDDTTTVDDLFEPSPHTRAEEQSRYAGTR